MELMPEIPKGWEFFSADFSMKVMNRRSVGGVMLVRDEEGRDKWHSLPPDLQEDIDLYVSGTGSSVAKAISAACSNAVKSGFGALTIATDVGEDGVTTTLTAEVLPTGDFYVSEIEQK